MSQLRDIVAGRKCAEELIQFADTANQSEQFLLGFWRAMQAANPATENAAEPVQPTSMNEQEAAAFEKELLGFGSHGDKTWGEAPIEYLLWLHERNQTLAKYLRSKTGQARQEAL